MTGIQIAAPDYRLAPDYLAPASFDDAKAAHAELPANGYAQNRIVLAGDSAVGGLALALLADLRREALTPAGPFAFSPWTDLAITGDGTKANAASDPLLPAKRMPEAVAMVLGTTGVRHPRVSPLYAQFVDPSPVLLQVGQGEILLDDCRRMADVLRRVGGEVQLKGWADCPQVWQMLSGYLPEARQALIMSPPLLAG